MELQSKIILTLYVAVADMLYIGALLLYRFNKKEYDRRYWGKNRTWLKNVNATNIVMVVIITLFIVGIWLE